MLHLTTDDKDKYLDFDFTLNKGAMVAEYKAKGRIDRFRMNSKAVIKNFLLEEFDHKYEQLKGDVTVSLYASGSTKDINYRPEPIKLGFIEFYFPWATSAELLYVRADFYVQFVINSNIQISLGKPNKCVASARFAYDTAFAVHFDGIDRVATADAKGHTIEKADYSYAAGTGQPSANFGVAFPHLVMKCGHQLATPSSWFHPAFVLGASWTVGNDPLIPNCMKIDARFLEAVGRKEGAEDDLFSFGPGKTLFDKTVNLVKQGNCPK
jgi:hypothetical protein